MELFFFWTHCIDFLLILVVFGVSIISFKFLVGKHKSSSTKLPPGKTGWPVVGETLEFINLGRKGVPEKFIKDRMKIFSSKIFQTRLFGESIAVFCGPSGNKFLFSNENKLVRGWWPKSAQTIFPTSEQATSSIEDMKFFYSIFPKYLSLQTLQTYIGTMDSMAKQHFEGNWKNNEEVIVYPLVQSYAFVLACRLFISVDDPSHIQKLSKPFFMLATGLISVPINLPGTSFHRAIKASVYLRKELLSIIKQRKIDLSEKNASPTQDILSHMLHDHIDDNGKLMNDIDIATKIIGLIFGSLDTVALTTTLTIKYLGELPEIYEKVRKEQMEIAESKGGELLNWGDIQKMKYSWNVVKEVLRLAPPGLGTFREAITDFTFGGYMIPKGWKLYWNVYSTHKNPEYFSNPEKFDPTRFEGKGPAPYTFVPFGGGPNMCPGKEYARLEILVFIHNLVTRYRWKKLILDEKVIYDPLPLPTHGLPIRLQAS